MRRWGGSDRLPGKSKKTVRKAVEHYVKKMKERGGVFKREIKEKLERTQEESEGEGRQAQPTPRAVS